MERRRVGTPTVRLAQSEDAPRIEAFRCGHSPWYVNDAAKVIRKAASLLGASPFGLRVLLFEHGDELAGISVLQSAPAPRTADIVVLAIQRRLQGAWMQESPERPLCLAVLEETARVAASEGYERIIAMAADENKKSVRLITRAGFVEARRLDGDYRLYVASLGVVSPK